VAPVLVSDAANLGSEYLVGAIARQLIGRLSSGERLTWAEVAAINAEDGWSFEKMKYPPPSGTYSGLQLFELLDHYSGVRLAETDLRRAWRLAQRWA
jgi:hypothetical protein